MKSNIYKVENSIEKVLDGKSTLFLDQKEFKEVKAKLKHSDYQIFFPYKDSEKVILYKKELPKVSLMKIKSYGILRHQDILGSLLSLNISSSYLGDIIIDGDNYYFYVLEELKKFVKDNLTVIGNNKVVVEEIDLSELVNYERKYEKCEKIVSSLRIDNVLSKIIGTNRDTIIEKIRDKEVILNNDVLTKITYILKENDTFSVRKYGKYKFVGVVNYTKKDNLIIEYLKYI